MKPLTHPFGYDFAGMSDAALNNLLAAVVRERRKRARIRSQLLTQQAKPETAMTRVADQLERQQMAAAPPWLVRLVRRVEVLERLVWAREWRERQSKSRSYLRG